MYLPLFPENINRQAACTTKTIGTNKAVAVGNYISDINPNIEQCESPRSGLGSLDCGPKPIGLDSGKAIRR